MWKKIIKKIAEKMLYGTIIIVATPLVILAAIILLIHPNFYVANREDKRL